MFATIKKCCVFMIVIALLSASIPSNAYAKWVDRSDENWPDDGGGADLTSILILGVVLIGVMILIRSKTKDTAAEETVPEKSQFTIDSMNSKQPLFIRPYFESQNTARSGPAHSSVYKRKPFAKILSVNF